MKAKKNKYLVAVSGGPDSMALLDICVKQKLEVEVAHINYHHRDSANRDELIVKNYCHKNKIVFHKKDFVDNQKGNFQARARAFRYQYFKDICLKKHLKAVFIGHHQDDLIETYLMQKEKKLVVNQYGLADQIYLNDLLVIRPLLDYTKKDLLNYCLENNIEYGIDESNLTDIYQRNIVRHHLIDQLNNDERIKILQEINNLNNELYRKELVLESYLNKDNIYDVDYFIKIPNVFLLLRRFLPNKGTKYYEELIRQIKDVDKLIYKDKDNYVIKQYEKVYLFKKKQDYEYLFKSMKDLKNKNYGDFKIVKKASSVNGAYLKEDDFPIIIRNAKKDDYIEMTFGKKKLNRFFIDKKIPDQRRFNYPVVVNCKDEIILLPGLGCNVSHYQEKYNFYLVLK